MNRINKFEKISKPLAYIKINQGIPFLDSGVIENFGRLLQKKNMKIIKT